MTPTELLRPRYIVISDYPGCPYKVGDIIELDRYNELIKLYYDPKTDHYENWFNYFPNLFRPLNWWEHREEKDMPEYLKDIEGFVDSQNNPMPVRVFKVRKHFSSNSGDWRDDKIHNFAPDNHHFLSLSYIDKVPATKEEYENQ